MFKKWIILFIVYVLINGGGSCQTPSIQLLAFPEGNVFMYDSTLKTFKIRNWESLSRIKFLYSIPYGFYFDKETGYKYVLAFDDSAYYASNGSVRSCRLYYSEPPYDSLGELKVLLRGLGEGCLVMKSGETIQIIDYGIGEAISNNLLYLSGIKGDSVLYYRKVYELPYKKAYARRGGVRHCNGRDWWILTQSEEIPYNDMMMIMLLTDTGFVYQTQKQVYYRTYLSPEVIQSNFSGDKLIWGQLVPSVLLEVGVSMYSFDREIGEMALMYLDTIRTIWKFAFDEQDNIYLVANNYYENPGDTVKLVKYVERMGRYIGEDTLVMSTYPMDMMGVQSAMYYLHFPLYIDGNVFLLVSRNKLDHLENGLVQVRLDGSKDFSEYVFGVEVDTILPRYIQDYPDLNINYLYNWNIYGLDHSILPKIRKGYGYRLLGCDDECGGYEVEMIDSSCCHFYRVWEYGDGAVDTFVVEQHSGLLGKLDTFSVVRTS